MLDIVPTEVDGAIVCNVVNQCRQRPVCRDCDASESLVIKIHNWLKHCQMEYAVFDFQDEKEICPIFIKELLLLRKRLPIHFLFSGVMSQARKLLEDVNYSDQYPFFLTPEDAVRALRMQDPGITETKLATNFQLNISLSKMMDHFYQQI